MFLNDSWILLFKLCLSGDNFSHEFSEFVVSIVIDVCGVVRDDLLLACIGEDLWGIDAIDGEALAGGLGGTYAAVVHVLILDVDDIFCLLAFVTLVLAEVLACSFCILLGPQSLRGVISRRHAPRGTGRTDHWFSGIGNIVW